MQWKNFNELLDKRMDEIQKLSDEINFNDLTYHFTGPSLASVDFIGLRGPLNIYHEIKNSNISIKKAKKDQKKFKSRLSKITSRNPKCRKEYQLDAIQNIKNLYNSRQKVINLFNDYAKTRSETMCKTKNGTGLKILTPKQMLQRLPIALA